MADGGEGITGEVQVGDGVQQIVGVLAHQAGQRVARVEPGIFISNAGHGFFHQGGVVLDVREQVAQGLALTVGCPAPQGDELLHKLVAHTGRFQAFGHHVL